MEKQHLHHLHEPHGAEQLSRDVVTGQVRTECHFYSCKSQQLLGVQNHEAHFHFVHSFPHQRPLCQYSKPRMTHTGNSGILLGFSPPPHFILIFCFSTEFFHKLKPEARGTTVLGLFEISPKSRTAKKSFGEKDFSQYNFKETN